ncbi:glutaredoxin family protein [Caldinitratiruptor microaerophilus]|uniref:NrdH-redoxin n=1 Tax=Caldinitratiruptor microaerophilus TaxID=671077 RepID=A0AA35G8S1_9FIRM|nr:glutaredoxin family protein [Caldinitratiruptor microaerophilus]BDG61356.1 NrdH-redoxin [Caldinitratiruptor microaerophilus]
MAQAQPRVVIFTTPTCPWCRRAKQYLTQQGVRFREVDVTRDPSAARDLVRMTGQTGVPVILVGNRPIVGFDKPQLDRLLNLQ